VIEAALDNQIPCYYLPEKRSRRDSWPKGDYLCAKSKRFFDSITKKGTQPGRLPEA
jgi:hypothetical protein